MTGFFSKEVSKLFFQFPVENLPPLANRAPVVLLPHFLRALIPASLIVWLDSPGNHYWTA